MVSRVVCRRARRDIRRSRVQHEHDRIPGGPDRPVLRRSDRHDDVSRDRQLRDHGRGRRIARHPGRWLHHSLRIAHREQLALRRHAPRLPRPQQRRRHFEHRHACAHQAAAFVGRHARCRRHRPAGPGRAGCARARHPADGRRRSRAGRDVRHAVRLRAAEETTSSRIAGDAEDARAGSASPRTTSA